MIVTLTINLWWVLGYFMIGALICELGRIYAISQGSEARYSLLTMVMVGVFWPFGMVSALLDRCMEGKNDG